MEFSTLGRTGLKVSVAGLGCGGPSRLGLGEKKSQKECVALVRRALELGVNFLDTAEVYGTEEIVGKAVSTFPRDRIVLSTKKTFPLGRFRDPARELRKSLEQSLRRLGTDYIDIYHLHGVEPEQYASASELLPPLVKLREEGKIRFLGVTEAFVEDPAHRMLQQALEDGDWDVVMVGFNLLNQSARDLVFPQTQERNIGVLNMFAVRRALSRPERLREVWAELVRTGSVDPRACNPEDPLDFLLKEGRASTTMDGAYRYCRHEPGVHVVLSGTGSVEHLEANIESILKPPLPAAALARLNETFAEVDCITGN